MADTRPTYDHHDRFFNRELSWLLFNWRVLEEAENRNHPVMERLRFLSISASNLDEFYMVRYAGLREQVRAGIQRVSQDGLTPAQQTARIEQETKALMKAQQQCWKRLKKELAAEGLKIVSPEKLTKSDKAWLDKTFEFEIFPILTPLAVDPAHPFPFIANRGFALAMALEPLGAGDPMTGLSLIHI